ncbi:MAG: Shedu immune nuclease family protein [Acidobacteriota bacterium]
MKAVTEFRDILSRLDPNSTEKYLKAIEQLPTSAIEDDFHFITPARFALVAYGESGVNALYQLCINDPIEAGHDSGTALLSIATGDSDAPERMVWLTHRYLDRTIYDRLVALIRANCGDPKLQSEAKRALARVFRHFAADPKNRRGLGIILNGLTMLSRDDSPGAQLISEIMSTATLSVSDELCDQADDLIRQDLLEKAYQQFFEKNPALLDPLASFVVPRQALADLWKTDFVIRRFDEQYLFVEFEKPRDPLFTRYPQPSPPLAHAIGQVMSWFAWIDDNLDYAQKHGFPNIHKPRGLIVVGRDSTLNEEQRRMLRTMNDLLDHRIHIWTYDEVVRNARNVVRNLTSR